MFTTELKPIDQKSFYGKAHIIEETILGETLYTLKSYKTNVMEYNKTTGKIKKTVDCWVYDDEFFNYSVTTQKHINAFLTNFGLETINKYTFVNMFEGVAYDPEGINEFIKQEQKNLKIDYKFVLKNKLHFFEDAITDAQIAANCQNTGKFKAIYQICLDTMEESIYYCFHSNFYPYLDKKYLDYCYSVNPATNSIINLDDIYYLIRDELTEDLKELNIDILPND